MRKLKLMLAMMLMAVLVCLNACGNDDDDNNTHNNFTNPIPETEIPIDPHANETKVTCEVCFGSGLCPDCNGSGQGCITCGGTGKYCAVCKGCLYAINAKEIQSVPLAAATDIARPAKTAMANAQPVAAKDILGYQKNESGATNDATVDLGLPSGNLWTTCNIGAANPWDYGDYYAWGETVSKYNYSWDTYKYGTSHDALTKYCNNSSYGKNGFTDAISMLEASDDIATVKLGANFHIPTEDEWRELFNDDYADRNWTEDYNGTGVKGLIVYKKKASRTYSTTTDTHIFLPAAGFRDGYEIYTTNTYGYYWLPSLDTEYDSDANFIFINPESIDWTQAYRYYGLSVRAVRHR